MGCAKGVFRDGNLLSMARFISDEARRRLATGWDPHVCTLREYARQTGVSERAIRNWRARLRHDGGTAVSGGNTAVPFSIQAVVTALQQRLEELEAAVGAARAAVTAAQATLDAAAACRDVPAGTETPRPVPVERKPMPRDAFFWG